MSTLRYRAKQVVFWAKARLERDHRTRSLALSQYVVERRHWASFPSPQDFHGDWREA